MKRKYSCFFAFLLVSCFFCKGAEANWDEWWTYDGISGPEFWGLMNMDWQMCDKGRRQSPVNIDPSKLVYDPHLRHLHVDKHKISGTVYNTGQNIAFRTDPESKHHINITGGPLVYKYRFEELYVHFGARNSKGSEHQIKGSSFPGEIQIYGYNADLYPNMSEAQHGSNGLVGVAIMVQINESGNEMFESISKGLQSLTFRGDKWQARHISIAGLLPDTPHYMTYEGSTTYPGCWETVTWIIMNKPIYMTTHQLAMLRSVMQGDRNLPKGKMANNFRQLRALHHRTVRTNIDFSNSHAQNGCSMNANKNYIARSWPTS